MKNILTICAAIGYSRCIRLILALVPALKLLVLDPLTAFFFKHLEDDGLMRCAESVGMLTPERKSGMLYRSGESFRASSTSVSGNSFYHRKSADGFNTSQVGLYFDSSPVLIRSEPSITKGSMNDGTSDRVPFNLLPPSFPDIPMESSPLKERKSVHFGLNENGCQELFLSRSTSVEHLSMFSTDGSLSDASTQRLSSEKKTVHFGLFDIDNEEEMHMNDIDK